MFRLFVVLLSAHLLSDFGFQTDKLIIRKRKLYGQFIHSIIVFFTTYIFLGDYKALLLSFIIFLTHLIIDIIKIKMDKNDNIIIFILDQVLHIIILFFLSMVFGDQIHNYWFELMGNDLLKILLVMDGILLNTQVAGLLIGKYIIILFPANNFVNNGLKNAGRIIGFLERLIVYIFVLSNNLAGIGFLVTAKSILRIGDITNQKSKAEAEYIIVGTFLSIVLALSSSYLIKFLMQSI